MFLTLLSPPKVSCEFQLGRNISIRLMLEMCGTRTFNPMICGAAYLLGLALGKDAVAAQKFFSPKYETCIVERLLCGQPVNVNMSNMVAAGAACQTQRAQPKNPGMLRAAPYRSCLIAVNALYGAWYTTAAR